jgi:hypothetical protein
MKTWTRQNTGKEQEINQGNGGGGMTELMARAL